MLSHMKLRNATINDLPDLANLWRERMVIIGQIDPRFAQNRIERETWIAKARERIHANDQQLIIAEESAALIGYIAGTIQPAPGRHGEKTVYGIIETIVLDAHTYHGGLGRGLFTAIKVWFDDQNVQKILIKAPRYYAVEQAFWRALGAKEWLPEKKKSPDWEVSPGYVWMAL